MFLFTRLTASDNSCLSFLSISSDINTFALGKLFSICNVRGIAGLEIVCANMENNVGGGGHFT